MDNEPDDDLDEDEDDDADVDPKIHRKNNATKNPAETLKFYPDGWQAVLQMAKQHWRLYVATENPFPNRSANLKDAADILAKAIQQFKEEGYVLESGCISCYVLYNT